MTGDIVHLSNQYNVSALRAHIIATTVNLCALSHAFKEQIGPCLSDVGELNCENKFIKPVHTKITSYVRRMLKQRFEFRIKTRVLFSFD